MMAQHVPSSKILSLVTILRMCLLDRSLDFSPIPDEAMPQGWQELPISMKLKRGINYINL